MNINPHAVLDKAITSFTPQEPPSLADIKNAAVWFGLSTFNDPKVEALVSAGLRWGRAIRDGRLPIWLALLGTSGIGKTVIATKLWKTQFDNKRTDSPNAKFIPQFIYWPHFVERLRDPESNARDMALDMGNWPVLVLDDIGAERDATGFASDKLNTILGTRSGKWTIITSNKHLSQLADMEIRIADRLQRDGGIVVESTAISFNQR